MLDPRVKTALVEYQREQRSLEETAQLLAQVQREAGCLYLKPSASAGPADRALAARFAELVAADGNAGPAGPKHGCGQIQHRAMDTEWT